MKPSFENNIDDRIPLANFRIVCPYYSLENDQHDSYLVDGITKEEARAETLPYKMFVKSENLFCWMLNSK